MTRRGDCGTQATGKPIGPACQHAARIWAIVGSPDNTCLVTASDDGTAKLWAMPVAVNGDIEEVNQWVQRITGLEMDEKGTIRVLLHPAGESSPAQE